MLGKHPITMSYLVCAKLKHLLVNLWMHAVQQNVGVRMNRRI
jgi:hypothetical protein